jgi:excisionase family DNA binding protein
MKRNSKMTKAYSIDEFCKSYGISKSFFYKLKKQGKAPAIMEVGKRTLISSASAQKWEAEMEATAP